MSTLSNERTTPSSELDGRTSEASADATTEEDGVDGSTVIPLIEERLEIGKRVVETGKVRLTKTVSEYHETLDEALAVRTYDIEHVVLNRPVDAPPEIRYEGETTIYPVIEEQLVITRQLILREEVRVTRRDTERKDTQTVTLRREHITVERESLLPAEPAKP